ncbi:ubiquitin-related modifier 1 [Mucidula mucida]|nr:ubiquitin-related modifier 1 [Mucidula mucida]
MSSLTLKVEFGGGLELLFSNQRVHSITLASSSTPTLSNLISHLAANLLTERPELFIENEKEKDSVRPGILVLVNDTDWELEGEGAYQLKDGDEIVFISTLHGG